MYLYLIIYMYILKKIDLYLQQWWRPESGLSTILIKIIILAIINTETVYYQIFLYKTDCDQSWANNGISLAITRAHEIEFVVASCQLSEDRGCLSQYKVWLIQINTWKLFSEISVISIGLYWIKALLHVMPNLMSGKAGFIGSLYCLRFHLYSTCRAPVKRWPQSSD